MALSIRAKNARDKLFSLYDQLNALWAQAEKQLTEYHIPREVAYRFWACPGYSEWLGIQKVKGAWRICYADHEGEDGPWDWFPIVECSADIRTRAASHLIGLRRAVVESSEAYIPVVESAIDILTMTLAAPLDDLLAERASLNGKA